MLRFLTAGESHGKALVTIVEGFPSNMKVEPDFINLDLKRRQSGYGRGLRMKIESDKVEILSGIRFKKTIGSPITLKIENNDWQNWQERMSPEIANEIEPITIPRPGHADLTGTLKYNYNDIRNSIERSSARETAARVAACSIAKMFLQNFGIHVGSFVESIGGVYPKKSFLENLLLNKIDKNFNAQELAYQADISDVRVLEKELEAKIINKIKKAKKLGDTLGGTIVVIATGVPAGLGSFIQYDKRLDTDLASHIMSINAIKGVELGSGFSSADIFGSESHDEITFTDGNFCRKTNRSGGVEGGISTGLPIIMRAAMKPIATLMSPINTVDMQTLQPIQARRERSDFVAVPACAVIAESMMAWVIAKHFLEKFGGDSIEETRQNYNQFMKLNQKRTLRNFKR